MLSTVWSRRIVAVLRPHAAFTFCRLLSSFFPSFEALLSSGRESLVGRFVLSKGRPVLRRANNGPFARISIGEVIYIGCAERSASVAAS